MHVSMTSKMLIVHQVVGRVYIVIAGHFLQGSVVFSYLNAKIDVYTCICDCLQEKRPFATNFIFTFWRIVHGTLYNMVQLSSFVIAYYVTGGSVGSTQNQPI